MFTIIVWKMYLLLCMSTFIHFYLNYLPKWKYINTCITGRKFFQLIKNEKIVYFVLVRIIILSTKSLRRGFLLFLQKHKTKRRNK